MLHEYVKYTFGEFLNLPDDEFKEYEKTGLLLKPDDWDLPDFMKWPYIQVKKAQTILSEKISYVDVIELIRELVKIKPDLSELFSSDENILQLHWFHVFAFLKFVINQIERVNELEERLAYEPDAAEERAGIDMYNQFGYFTTIDRLAGGDPLKYEEIGQTEYSVIFSKLLLNKVDSQFIKNYHKAITK